MKWILVSLLMGSQNPIQIVLDDKAACEAAATALQPYVQPLKGGKGVHVCIPTAIK